MAQLNERIPADSSGGDFRVVTRFGNTSRPGQQTVLHVAVPGEINRPAVLALDAVSPSTGAVTTSYLWVDSANKLRISTTFPVTADSDGTVVGSQS